MEVRKVIKETRIALGERPPGMLAFYHGGAEWQRRPEVRPAKQGRYEGGPGIYLTTSYMRAVSYAGGSKIVQKVFVAKDAIRYAEDTFVELEDAISFLSTIRIRSRKNIVADLENYKAKAGNLRASTVINL